MYFIINILVNISFHAPQKNDKNGKSWLGGSWMIIINFCLLLWSLSLSLVVEAKEKMAYRRRQGISRASTFKEEIHSSLDDDPKDSHQQNGSTPSLSSSNSSSPSLAAQAIKASAARRQPALSFAFDSSHPDHQRSTVFGSRFLFCIFWYQVLIYQTFVYMDRS